MGLYSYIHYLHTKRREGITEHKRFLAFQQIIKKQLLTTYFQPILDLKCGDNIGYEILNRPPVSTLFPTTETFYDFVGQTDQVFLFERFCRRVSLKRFVDCLIHLPSQQNALLFLNIHPHVLGDAQHKSGETLQLLKEFGVSPSQIVFEITEKQAVNDYVMFEQVLSHYRKQGFRIAVDDAGSGYNSLKTLVYLKPEFIKLDRSLIQNIDENPAQQHMVTLLLDYANRSDTYVIAEGIERLEELAFLRKSGIHMGQGYALGRPQRELRLGTLP